MDAVDRFDGRLSADRFIRDLPPLIPPRHSSLSNRNGGNEYTDDRRQVNWESQRVNNNQGIWGETTNTNDILNYNHTYTDHVPMTFNGRGSSRRDDMGYEQSRVDMGGTVSTSQTAFDREHWTRQPTMPPVVVNRRPLVRSSQRVADGRIEMQEMGGFSDQQTNQETHERRRAEMAIASAHSVMYEGDHEEFNRKKKTRRSVGSRLKSFVSFTLRNIVDVLNGTDTARQHRLAKKNKERALSKENRSASLTRLAPEKSKKEERSFGRSQSVRVTSDRNRREDSSMRGGQFAPKPAFMVSEPMTPMPPAPQSLTGIRRSNRIQARNTANGINGNGTYADPTVDGSPVDNKSGDLLPGYPNIGNTCYISAALQVLFALFRDEIINRKWKNRNPHCPPVVFDALTEFFIKICSTNVCTDADISRLVSALKSISSLEIENYQQDDAALFLIKLINRIHDEIKIPADASVSKPDSMNSLDQYQSQLRQTENSEIYALTHSIMRTQVKCATCQEECLRMDCTSMYPITILEESRFFENFVRVNFVRYDERANDYINVKALMEMPDETTMYKAIQAAWYHDIMNDMIVERTICFRFNIDGWAPHTEPEDRVMRDTTSQWIAMVELMPTNPDEVNIVLTFGVQQSEGWYGPMAIKVLKTCTVQQLRSMIEARIREFYRCREDDDILISFASEIDRHEMVNCFCFRECLCGPINQLTAVSQSLPINQRLYPEHPEFLRATFRLVKSQYIDEAHEPVKLHSSVMEIDAQFLSNSKLERALKVYMHSETREWKCSMAHSEKRSKGRVEYAKPAEIIFFQLRRANVLTRRDNNPQPIKVTNNLDLPIEIDLQPFCFNQSESGRMIYQLVAVITHLGNDISSGHYVTSVYYPKEGRFVSYNDNQVMRVTHRQVAREPYLLVYRKKKNDGNNNAECYDGRASVRQVRFQPEPTDRPSSMRGSRKKRGFFTK